MHIRVMLAEYDVHEKMCTFVTNDGDAYYVPREYVTAKVFRVNWYASLFTTKDGEVIAVRMD